MVERRFKYRIFPDKKLILERFSGKFDIRDLLRYQLSLSRDDEFSSAYNEFFDIRDAEFIFTQSEIAIIIYFMKKNRKLIGNRKIAYLVDSTNQVIHSLLFKAAADSLPMEVETVRDIDTALDYLGLPNNEAAMIEESLKVFEFNAVLV